VDASLNKPWYLRALRFLPALLLTLGLELVNAAVVGSSQSWLRDHWLLVMFMPVISALAGNIGLQTSSSVSSAENVRREQQQPLPVLQVARTYWVHNLMNIVIMGVLQGGIAFLWEDKNCRMVHSLIIRGQSKNELVGSRV
jgi:cation transporter-like permease